MAFATDQQTQDDLLLLGIYRKNSVFSLFNRTATAGGERFLEKLFNQPLDDAQSINARSNCLAFLTSRPYVLPVSADVLADAYAYLYGAKLQNRFVGASQHIRLFLMAQVGIKTELNHVKAGIHAVQQLLKSVFGFLEQLKDEASSEIFAFLTETINNIVSDPAITAHLKQSASAPAVFFSQMELDYLFRGKFVEYLENLIQWLFQLDAYFGIAAVARERNFSFAEAKNPKENELSIEMGYHPCLQHAVANTYHFRAEKNLIFLTGANMAGKSTYMKTFGILVYLAHMGFPVPCRHMAFSVKEGLYTSINVPDDLKQGYSHYYAEVKRVKLLATEINKGRNLIVVFDELFKGTNVKDAHEATSVITRALRAHDNCFFIISTHILEVAQDLTDIKKHLQYYYMPTYMEGNTPRYTYQAEEGISSDRQGMRIIENEKILDILAQAEKTMH